MTRFALLPAAALAACASAAPQPAQVSLTDTLLTVRMSNGTICQGPAPAEGLTSWSGQLQDCPTPFAYSVEIDPGTNPTRFILEELLTSLGGEALFAPFATVEITSDTGVTRTFVSPPPDLDDEQE